MRKRTIIATLLASTLGVAALASPSLAMRGGMHAGSMHMSSGGGGRMHMYSGGRMHMYSAGRPRVYAWQGRTHSNFRFRHGRRVFLAAGYPYYDYDYGYGGCGWLYRRAVATGSAYWWQRYRACSY
jgi:hypothetical protein